MIREEDGTEYVGETRVKVHDVLRVMEGFQQDGVSKVDMILGFMSVLTRSEVEEAIEYAIQNRVVMESRIQADKDARGEK